MVDDIAIRVEGLGKKYVIGHQAEREQYTALRDVIGRNTRAFVRSVRDLASGRPNVAGDEIEEFWALRGLDFEVKRGEIVGVIGRNGAGKSTLLKVLSRITEPSEGRVTIKGRLASLLEVGTGFHPELSGRENIFLNGAILGMSRAETRRKFDEIVDFAEVERFLDTPVKRYSSGMYVRLAFAVAAFLEPDILIVDEVLAVGDAAFQKKSLGKMSSFADRGMTVLLVSHNMGLVRDVCDRGIILDSGHITYDGTCVEAVSLYLQNGGEHTVGTVWRPKQKPVGGVAIEEVRLMSADGEAMSEFVIGDGLRVDMDVDFDIAVPHPQLGLSIHASDGTPILDLRTRHAGPDIPLAKGPLRFTVGLDELNLYPGDYILSVWITDTASKVLDWAEYCIAFSVMARPGPFGDMRLSLTQGKYYVRSDWTWMSRDLAPKSEAG